MFRSESSTVTAAVSGDADCTCDIKSVAVEAVGAVSELSASSMAGVHVNDPTGSV